MEVRFRHCNFPKKRFRTALSMWTCTQLLSAKYCHLLRKTKLQNAYSPHIPHSGKKKKNQQLGRAQLTLQVLPWTQRAYSEASWATSGETTRVCVIPSSAHIEHWLQFYEVKMPKKKKMWRRCPQSFLSREGSSKQQATASGYWERSLRLSVIGYYGSLTFAAFTCLSTTDTYISLVEMSGKV